MLCARVASSPRLHYFALEQCLCLTWLILGLSVRRLVLDMEVYRPADSDAASSDTSGDLLV